MDAAEEELAQIRARKLAELARLAARPPAPDAPVEVTGSTLQDFVEAHPLAVVDCWAVWCGPCRVMEPVIDDLARELQGRVAFGKLNVDEHPGVAQAYRVSSIPTFLVFRKGELADRIVGAMAPSQMKARLRLT